MVQKGLILSIRLIIFSLNRVITMKLKVPVNSFESAVRQIQAGADEIYMGMDDSVFTNMSFSARAQITSHGVHSTLSPSEFQKTVDYAHSKNVSVNFTVNCQYMSNSPHNYLRQKYLEHVVCGIDMGSDALIVSDIGNILFLRTQGVTAPVIAGSYFNAFNSETLHILEELGVIRVCLPDQMKLSEIKEMKAATNLEIEIFIGYGCSNLSGSCNFCHNNGEQIHVGVTCRNSYDVDGFGECSILDACCNCAVCAIPSLIDIGVDSVKLIGRETVDDDLFHITRMYKFAIDSCQATGYLDKTAIISQIPWWEKVMCFKRCKYSPCSGNIFQSYI